MNKIRVAAMVAGVLAAGALVGSAGAADQIVTAQLGSSVSMTASPADISDWALSATGANTRTGGSFTVSANTGYTVTVVAEKATMSEWDGAQYVTSGKSLASPLTITATRSGGTALVPGVGVGAITGTTGQALATGDGGGTDDYSLQFSQPTTVADAPLSGSNRYRNKFTYTASPTI